MNKLKIRFITNFPLSIVYGGFEHQCVQTCLALQSIGVDAKLLNWHDAKENDYILHLFAPDPMWSRIIEHWAGRNPIVMSAIMGTEGFNRRKFLQRKLLNNVAHALRQETVVGRTRQMIHRVDKLICLNSLEKNFFLRNYELPNEKVEIIYNGVSDLRFTASKIQFYETYHKKDFVLFVGNISKRKNPLLLAKCLERIGVKGVFIGGRSRNEVHYNNEFENFINNSPDLLWIKGLKYDDPILSSAFAAAKVFCLPSTAETQPLSAMEAMASGTPVILGDYPYAYQTPFESSLKVDPKNKEKLMQILQKLMSLKTTNNENLSKEYSWKNVAAKLLKIYLKLKVD